MNNIPPKKAAIPDPNLSDSAPNKKAPSPEINTCNAKAKPKVSLPIFKYSVTGMRLMQAVAAGEMTGAYLNVTYTNSLDQLMVGSKEVFSNPEMLAQMKKHDIQVHRRSMSRML